MSKEKIIESFVYNLRGYIEDYKSEIKRLEYRLEISEQERIKLIDKLNDKEKANSTHEDIDKYYENEETIEEKIFEVYQELYKKNEVSSWYFVKIQEFKDNIINKNTTKIEKQRKFLNIMKAVHYYIEGDNKEYKECYYIFLYNRNKYLISYSIAVDYNPYYFKFSIKENAEKAKEILSNFFGINLLDWWYK